MKFFAFIYKRDLDLNKQAYIWFNRKEHHLSEEVVAVPQAQHQHDTEMLLIQEVRKLYPTAVVLTDEHWTGDYRCVRL